MGGDLVLGVDLVKDADVLNRAYNDPEGITAAFNLNMLRHLNSLIGSDFDLSGFAHRAFFNADAARIEMHLVSLRPQKVRIGGACVAFEEGETIHTENSHKYTLERLAGLAERSGWQVAETWCDPKQWFSLNLLRAL